MIRQSVRLLVSFVKAIVGLHIEIRSSLNDWIFVTGIEPMNRPVTYYGVICRDTGSLCLCLQTDS